MAIITVSSPLNVRIMANVKPVLSSSCSSSCYCLCFIYLLQWNGGGVLNFRTVDFNGVVWYGWEPKYSSYCCNLKSCQEITWQKKIVVEMFSVVHHVQYCRDSRCVLHCCSTTMSWMSDLRSLSILLDSLFTYYYLSKYISLGFLVFSFWFQLLFVLVWALSVSFHYFVTC